VALWLTGWTGDNAGNVVGREPNTLIVTLTISAPGLLPRAINFTYEMDGGVIIYPFVVVDCLMPNARPAVATKIANRGSGFAIEVMEVDLGRSWGGFGDEPWGAGVHLFSVMVEDGDNHAATIATAVIDDNVPRLDRARLELMGPLMWAALRERRLTPRDQ
jgi:hypothetical protein